MAANKQVKTQEHKEVYTLLCGESTTTEVNENDAKAIRIARETLLPTYPNMVATFDKYLPTTDSGRASGGHIYLITERTVKVGEKNKTMKVIIADIAINGGNAYDTKLYYDYRPASANDIVNHKYNVETTADGQTVFAKQNSAGVSVMRGRSIDYIITNTDKRVIDTLIEIAYSKEHIKGTYNVYYNTDLLVD